MNVLFVIVDDLRPELGCYGRSKLRTPNIDALAGRGMRFDRHYCQQAICAPSRHHIMTGRRPDSTGIYELSTRLRARHPAILTLPQHFKANGYRTLSFGKVYHHVGDDDAAGWSEAPVNRRGQDVGRGYVTAESIAVMQQLEATLAAQGRAGTGLGPPFEIADVDDDAYGDGANAAAAIEGLRSVKDERFFLAAGFLKPHLPFCAPRKYWEMYDRDEIEVPDDQPPEGVTRYTLTDFGELRQFQGIPGGDAPLPRELARTLIHGYYACVSYLDAQVGRLLDELDRLRLRERTMVVLCTDHAFKLGEHASWSKHTVTEADTHIPLVISPPGMGSRSTQRLSENVDIFPTLCDLCGLPTPQGMEGDSLRPLFDDPQQLWKQAVFSQYPRGSVQLWQTERDRKLRGEPYTCPPEPMGYGMRTERYRYVEWRSLDEQVMARELYDHATDPGEHLNLAPHPDHAATVQDLAQQMRSGWQAARP